MIIFFTGISTCSLLLEADRVFVLLFTLPEPHLLLRKKIHWVPAQLSSSFLVGWYRASLGRCQWNKFPYCLISADVRKATSWRWALQITWQLWILSMPQHFLIIRSLKHKQNSPALIFAVLALVQYVMWFVCICKYCLCSQKADKAWMYLYHREGLL